MQAYMKELPEVPDEEWEEEETLEAERLGLLECLVADDLDPAIEKLESVTRFGPPAASSPGAERKGSVKKKRRTEPS